MPSAAAYYLHFFSGNQSSYVAVNSNKLHFNNSKIVSNVLVYIMTTIHDSTLIFHKSHTTFYIFCYYWGQRLNLIYLWTSWCFNIICSIWSNQARCLQRYFYFDIVKTSAANSSFGWLICISKLQFTQVYSNACMLHTMNCGAMYHIKSVVEG